MIKSVILARREAKKRNQYKGFGIERIDIHAVLVTLFAIILRLVTTALSFKGSNLTAQ